MGPVDAAVLAIARRGDTPESVVRGHLAVVAADGELWAAAGNATQRFPVRSTVKPLQVLPFITSGAADRCDDAEAAIAVACGSHQGEAGHVTVVRHLLTTFGLDDESLWNGPALPSSRSARQQLLAKGESAAPIYHNCSGKHAAMLATCAHNGWPTDGYALAGHAAQQSVRAAFREHAGVDLRRHAAGIDGCGLPTYALDARSLAAAFSYAQEHSAAFGRALEAMRARPELVGGREAFDTAVIANHGVHGIVGKSGAAACWVGLSRHARAAVVLKLESGSAAWLPQLALAVLEQLNWIQPAPSRQLDRFRDRAITNSRGEHVGELEIVVDLR